MIAPERLATDRLTLRPLLSTDAEALFPAFSDPELMTWWSSGPHASVEETRAFNDQAMTYDPAPVLTTV